MSLKLSYDVIHQCIGKRKDDGSRYSAEDIVSDACELQLAKVVFWASARLKELRATIDQTPKSDDPAKACERGIVVGRARQLQDLLKELGAL